MQKYSKNAIMQTYLKNMQLAQQLYLHLIEGSCSVTLS